MADEIFFCNYIWKYILTSEVISLKNYKKQKQTTKPSVVAHTCNDPSIQEVSEVG